MRIAFVVGRRPRDMTTFRVGVGGGKAVAEGKAKPRMVGGAGGCRSCGRWVAMKWDSKGGKRPWGGGRVGSTERWGWV